MKVKYYQTTDSLYIDQASTKVALDKLIISCMRGKVETEAD